MRQRLVHLLCCALSLCLIDADAAFAQSADSPSRPAAKKATLPVAVAGAHISILYPDLGEPLRSVFTRIIDGIHNAAGTSVSAYPIGTNPNRQQLQEDIRQRDTRAVIALGRNGISVAAGLASNVGVVASGIVTAPGADTRGMSIVSMAPDPAILFGRLKSLAPQVRRVFVTYDPQANGWLIPLAQQAAKAHNLELAAKEVSDLNSAMQFYQDFLANADPRRDALWLIQDATTVQESVVLPVVLRGSWARSLTVFSSNVNHVKHGVLFALFPDNYELGRHLGQLAVGVVNGNASPGGIAPLREVKFAVNINTANHLGIGLTPRLQQEIDLLLPES